MKHFIVEITYTLSPQQIAEILPAHRAFLQTGYERGWLLLSGPQIPKTGGVVVARAPSLEELQAFFQSDPYQHHQAAIYRYTEFDPVKRQPWLESWVTGNDIEG